MTTGLCDHEHNDAGMVGIQAPKALTLQEMPDIRQGLLKLMDSVL